MSLTFAFNRSAPRSFEQGRSSFTAGERSLRRRSINGFTTTIMFTSVTPSCLDADKDRTPYPVREGRATAEEQAIENHARHHHSVDADAIPARGPRHHRHDSDHGAGSVWHSGAALSDHLDRTPALPAIAELAGSATTKASPQTIRVPRQVRCAGCRNFPTPGLRHRTINRKSGGHHGKNWFIGSMKSFCLTNLAIAVSRLITCCSDKVYVKRGPTALRDFATSVDELHSTSSLGIGAPSWIRTNGLQLRRLTLYPAELWALTGTGNIVPARVISSSRDRTIPAAPRETRCMCRSTPAISVDFSPHRSAASSRKMPRSMPWIPDRRSRSGCP